MSRSGFGTPIAVLLGAGLIAWVVARGFDRMAAAEASRPAPSAQSLASVSGERGPAAAIAPVLDSGARQERDEVRVRAEEQAQFAMVPQRDAYARLCWKPPGNGAGGPPDLGGVFKFDIGFDAQGAETTRTLQATGPARPELADCVAKTKLPALKIAPPGKPLTVPVSVAIP